MLAPPNMSDVTLSDQRPLVHAERLSCRMEGLGAMAREVDHTRYSCLSSPLDTRWVISVTLAPMMDLSSDRFASRTHNWLWNSNNPTCDERARLVLHRIHREYPVAISLCFSCVRVLVHQCVCYLVYWYQILVRIP